jgi:hypothetical protein
VAHWAQLAGLGVTPLTLFNSGTSAHKRFLKNQYYSMFKNHVHAAIYLGPSLTPTSGHLLEWREFRLLTFEKINLTQCLTTTPPYLSGRASPQLAVIFEPREFGIF